MLIEVDYGVGKSRFVKLLKPNKLQCVWVESLFNVHEILASILQGLNYEAKATYRRTPDHLKMICNLTNYFIIIDEANDLDRRAWPFEKLDTLRHRIIQKAGRLVRPQCKLTLTMSANQVVQRGPSGRQPKTGLVTSLTGFEAQAQIYEYGRPVSWVSSATAARRRPVHKFSRRSAAVRQAYCRDLFFSFAHRLR